MKKSTLVVCFAQFVLLVSCDPAYRITKRFGTSSTPDLTCAGASPSTISVERRSTCSDSTCSSGQEVACAPSYTSPVGYFGQQQFLDSNCEVMGAATYDKTDTCFADNAAYYYKYTCDGSKATKMTVFGLCLHSIYF
jgi:hypothetical protein